MRISYSVGFSLLSGVGLGLIINYPFLWPLSFVVLFPLLHVIYNLKTKAWKSFLLYAVGAWAYGLTVMFWSWAVLPLKWAGISDPVVEFLLVFYFWILAAPVFWASGCAAWIFSLVKRNKWHDALTFGALWVCFEFIRSFGVSILWSGPESLLGAHWSIGFAGYTIAPSNVLVALSQLGGVYLLSFIVVAVNVFLYQAVIAAVRRDDDLMSKIFIAGGTIVGLFIVAFFVYMANPRVGQFLNIAVFATHNSSSSVQSGEDIFSAFSQKMEFLKEVSANEKKSDIILFPEDSHFLAMLNGSGQKSVVDNLFQGSEVLIVDSSRTSSDLSEEVMSKFLFFNTETGETVESGKQFLIPHGEYMPYLTDSLIGLFGQNEWIKGFRERRLTTKSDEVVLADFQGVKIGALACSEAISPELNRNITQKGSAFLINMASHSLFNGSRILSNQTLSVSRVRANENNRYYVQAGNFVESFILDNFGRVVAISDFGTNSVIYGSVGVIEKDSFYNLYGRFLMVIFVMMILVFAFARPRFLKT